MCSRNNVVSLRNTPKWLMILLVFPVLIFVGVIAYYIATNLTSSFEKDSIETKTDNEVIKGSRDDYCLNIHLEKHRANLDHEKT